MEEESDWFRASREQHALQDAFVSIYRDERHGTVFYGIDTFDPAFCSQCAETTEMVEEVTVVFVETEKSETIAEVKRMKCPRILCRECLTFLDVD